MKQDVRIAVAFEKKHLQEWYDLLFSAVQNRYENLHLIPCSCLDELIKARPSIIVGHESTFLTNYLIDKPQHLEWVHFMSAGLNKTLSSIGKDKQPFRISNVGGIHGAAIGEYVFSIILYFEKQLSRWSAQQQEKEWLRGSINLVEGKTILIAGTGYIGRAVAQMAKCFSLEVLGISRCGKLKPPFDKVSTLKDMKSELANVDYVVASMPLTESTRGAFNYEEFYSMKPGAIFINISRGELVNENALIDALNSGHLAGAAMDAFSEEPLGETSPLWSVLNLLITPHVAGKFSGGRDLGIELFLDNLMLFMNEKKLKTEVFPERGY